MPEEPPHGIAHRPIARHWGLDWLRIGAFALLILYHIGMYFAPVHWIVQSVTPQPWIGYVIAGLTPWRLMILFAVSGFATAAMLQRFPAIRAFFAERSRRLLIPLAFGMLVIVPPQGWVRLDVAGMQESLLWFWTHEEFAFARVAGQFLPNWEHLWFLAYLWAYTALLALFLTLVPAWRAVAAPIIGWFAQGWRLLWVPLILLVLGRFALVAAHLDDANRFSDLVGDVHYFPAFLLGFAIAHYSALWAAVRRIWPASLAVALTSLAILFWGVAVEGAGGPGLFARTAADTAMAWAMIPVMFQLADIALNRDHGWRQPLALAIFPAYIIHQTVIVLVGWRLSEAGIGGMRAFVVIASATIFACWLTWRIAAASRVMGTLLGMPHKPEKADAPAPAIMLDRIPNA